MKNVSLLVPEGDASLSNIEATYKMFTKVNEALEREGKPALFKVQLIGLTAEPRHTHVFSIKPDYGIGDPIRSDLIIIPAVHGDPERVLAANRDFLPWIEKQYKSGSEVVSLCIGAFILAATGLVDGRSCTTHWLAAGDFQKMFPNVLLQPYKILTDEHGIYTSGGAYSSLNLILYLVEKFAGREMAILSAKIFEIEIDRFSQSPFIMFKGQKDHEDDAVIRAQEYIENNYTQKITVGELADMLALGRRNLERRFKSATSNTVVEYIQRVRVEVAKRSYERSQKNVHEVMYELGYADTKAFRALFRRFTGMTPSEYRSRYNKQMVSHAEGVAV